ncbi:MAG: hypothetical protein GX925_07515 [Clostridiales bacterium]|nr:hypothetical protein [Clostridiales bacterium]
MKKLILFLLVAVMVFTLAACKPKAPVEDENDTGNKDPVEDNTIVDPSPEGEIATVKLYFANREYIMTGNDNLDATVAVEREVKVKEKPIEEVILEELRNKPEDEGLTTLVEKIKVLSVETAENTAYVNLSGENLHGGSLEESLILQQIVFSLTELKKIEKVQLLVDGSKRETLMGHISIEEPLKGPDVK